MQTRCIRSTLLTACAAVPLMAQVLTIEDGTPVRLRLNSTVSSGTAHEGDMVDFEVTEPLVARGLVLIPKGSIALGHVSKVRAKRRFGRAGELEISIDSVRVGDGGTAPLRATKEEGETPLQGGKLAATVVASPVLVWVKGKNVEFERGVETTAYVRGNVTVDEAKLRAPYQNAPQAVQNAGNPALLTNRDILDMKKAGLSEEVILAKIATSPTDFRTSPQDLIELKNAAVSDRIIEAMVQKQSPPR
jgi:hypothetical protein